jgi:hypothetical protein
VLTLEFPEPPSPVKKPKVNILSNEKLRMDSHIMDSLYDTIRDSRQELLKMHNHNKELTSQLQIVEESEKKWKVRYHTKVQEVEEIDKKLSNFFGDSQKEIIYGMTKPRWDTPTLEKMAALKENIGDRNLAMMSKNFFPAPNPSTIRRHTQNLKFTAGIQTLNLRVLKRKGEILELAEHQKKLLIGFDEKAIVPGVKYDPSTRQRVGFATLDSTDRQKAKNPDNLATHGQLYLAMGLNPRFKEIIGFDYTTNATDPESTKKRIFELIIKTESETGMEVMGLVMDMGASNMSFLRLIGIQLKKRDPIYHFPHPANPSRKIFIIFDPVHFIKNLACGIRNHDAVLSDKIVKENNLNSSTAKFQDILDLYERQKDQEIKFAPNLTHEVLFPTNFEKMQEDIAYNLLSPEVSQGLDLIFGDTPRKNPTAFVLETFHRLKQIYTNENGWSIDRWNEYEEDINFLKYLVEEFFPDIKFQMSRGSLKSVEGAIIGISSTIEIRGDLFDTGADRVHPKNFLNNPVENKFAEVTMCYTQPDAIQFQRALKSISIKGYQKPVKGSSYRFEKSNEDIPTVNFIPMIKEMAVDQSETQTEEVYEILNIALPEKINQFQLFPSQDPVHLFAFHKNVIRIIHDNLSRLQECPQCLQDLNPIEEKESFHLSSESLNFFCLLEHCYRLVISKVPLYSKHLEEIFIINSSAISYCNHCEAIQDLFIKKYLKFRLPLSIPSRAKHMIDRYSSKSLAK